MFIWCIFFVTFLIAGLGICRAFECFYANAMYNASYLASYDFQEVNFPLICFYGGY